MHEEKQQGNNHSRRTSGSFCLKETPSLASSVFSQTILPSCDASTTPPELLRLFVDRRQKHHSYFWSHA